MQKIDEEGPRMGAAGDDEDKNRDLFLFSCYLLALLSHGEKSNKIKRK